MRLNTNLMHAYELEKNNLGHRLFEAKEKIKELTAVANAQGQQLGMISRHEFEREKSWIAEIQKNEELRAMLHKADHEVFVANTTTLFGLNQTIDEQNVRIAKLHTEKDLRKQAQELDAKLAKESKTRVQQANEKLHIKINILEQ